MLTPMINKCLRNEIHKNTVVTGTYKITKVNNDHKTSIKIVDSKTHTLYSKDDAVDGKFSFTTSENDFYDICFYTQIPQGIHNPHSTFNSEVSIVVRHGVEAKNYEEIAVAGKLKPLEIEMRRLEDLSEEIVNDYAYMKQREEEMRDTNESTGNRLFYFSIFSMSTLQKLLINLIVEHSLFLLICCRRKK
ncbi:hypothetical protein SNEBB_004266 [Seison nebaliae]|nr:hypothetical protein SNEBB_004266 [Seison nebaliae]